MIVEGMVHGGVVQGVGQALQEEGVYDESGQLITGSMMDYALPTAEDVPSIITDRTVTPSPTNPLGVKGAGETGTIAASPAGHERCDRCPVSLRRQAHEHARQVRKGLEGDAGVEYSERICGEHRFIRLTTP